MDDLEPLREFFRQKYAYLGLPDTDETLAAHARLWEAEQRSTDAQAAATMARVMALADAKQVQIDQAEVIEKKSRREFKPGNAGPQKYDQDLYLPKLMFLLDRGVPLEAALLETANAYLSKHPDTDKNKLVAAMRRNYFRKKKK